MKAVLSNRIYLEVDSRTDEAIREELTYPIPSHTGEPIIIRNYNVFRPGILSLPIGRVDLIPAGHEILDKRVLNPVEFPPFRFTLRPSQAEVHDDLDDNCIINAKVSWGKTFTGMAIAGKLGQKTLIVVHTVALMHQWAKQVEKVYGFKPSLIGNGHDSCDKPITIGNVQSLYNRMDRLGKEFGTLIMDEMHHVSSPTFYKVVDRCYARYKIGLSGTIQRKDGRHVVFQDFFGKKLYKPAKENSVDPVIHILDSGIYFPDSQKLCWADKVTALLDSSAYRSLIVQLCEHYSEEGHKVLVVSDRTDFQKHLQTEFDCAMIIGETKDREAEFEKLNSGATRILCGTQSILSEGISHDPLSCLIPATPINNMPLLEQLIGRVVRIAPGKLQPVVVDVRLRGHTVEKQFMNRVGHYMKEGFDIKYL